MKTHHQHLQSTLDAKQLALSKLCFVTRQKCESLNCWCQRNRQMIIKLIVSYVCKMTSHSMFYNFILAYSHKRHDPIESFECVNIYHDFNCMVNEQIHTTLFLRPVTA